MTTIDTWTGTLQDDIRGVEKNLRDVDTKLNIRAQGLEVRIAEVEARVELGVGGRTGNDAGRAKPPKFDGSTLWAMFRRQFETVAGHNRWMPQEKATYLIAALQGLACDVLHGVPRGATAIEQLAHRAYPALPEDHVRKEAGRAFTDGVEDPDINPVVNPIPISYSLHTIRATILRIPCIIISGVLDNLFLSGISHKPSLSYLVNKVSAVFKLTVHWTTRLSSPFWYVGGPSFESWLEYGISCQDFQWLSSVDRDKH
jgi:hypothetical protein